MGNFFSKIGGMIGKGWNTVANTFLFPIPQTYSAIKSNFFPTQQKTIITNDQVSSQPYTSYVGYRPQSKDATTLGVEYQSWWNKSYEYGRKLWDNFKTSFMGYSWEKLGQDFGKTAASVVGQTTQKAIATLPDYFMQKWGLVERPQDEYTQNNAGANPQGSAIYYLNPTQTSSPATQETGVLDFFKSILSSQPQGSYSIGYPQSQPIPVSVPIPVGSQGVDNKTGSLYTIAIIAAIGLGLLLLFKKGK